MLQVTNNYKKHCQHSLKQPAYTIHNCSTYCINDQLPWLRYRNNNALSNAFNQKIPFVVVLQMHLGEIVAYVTSSINH